MSESAPGSSRIVAEGDYEQVPPNRIQVGSNYLP